MKTLNAIAMILLIVGGLNWGIYGLFQYDLVGLLFGGMDSIGSRIVYGLVGLAAIYGLTLYKPATQGVTELHHTPSTAMR
jgi:uncharacterized membrane protein YuzA (DUF378 family)